MIFKIALLTCLFYLCMSLLVEGVLFILASRREDLIFGGAGWGLRTLFFAIWIVAFSLATHFVFRASPH